MGSKGATTTTTSAPPKVVEDMYKYLTEQGKTLQQQPYQPYTGQMVAELNPIQQQGIAQAGQYAQAAQPYYQGAAAGTLGAMQGYTPEGFQQGVGGYMSPYLQNAMGSTAALLANQQAQQRQELLGKTIASGAFGGDRGKIAQVALMGQQNLATGQTLGQMAQAGYSDAAKNYLASLGAQGALASQLGQLGTAAQTAGLTGAQALTQAGGTPYQVEQAKLASQYGQFAQGQAYPFQTLGYLAHIASGLGAGQGGTSSTTQPGPNVLGQAFGTALSLASLPWSDKRLKEDIQEVGKTFDGQPIYSFKYKGDDKTQIGLMAQDVEKKHPEAVGLAGGYKTVDYAKATEDAAERGKFYLGGASMGGLVPAGQERQAYATKGAVGILPYLEDPVYELMAKYLKVPITSIVPEGLSIKAGGVGIPEAPKGYEDKGMDISKGLQAMTGGQKANLVANIKDILGYYNVASDSGLGGQLGQSMYALGGLVPREHHADGEAAGTKSTVALPDVPYGSDKPTIFEHVTGMNLSPDARAGMLAAGLGMMASRSPFFGTAVGEGGLAGLNTYYNAIKNKYEVQKNLAELGLTGRRVAVEEAGIPLRSKEIENAILQTKIKQFEDWRNLYQPIYEGQKIVKWSDPNGNPIEPSEFASRQINFMRNIGIPVDAYLGSQERASGGRAGYQQAGAVPSPNDEEQLPADLMQQLEYQKRIDELQKNVPYWVKNKAQQEAGYSQLEAARKQLLDLQERKYQTETGMEYQLRKDAKPSLNPPPTPFGESTPRGEIDPNTGLIKTAPVNIGYPATKGYPTSELPKYGVKVGRDPIYEEAVKGSGPMETEFLEQSQNTQESLVSLAKFAAAAKALETGALTGDKVKIAAVMRSLGFDQAATAVAGAKDVAEAQKLAKTAIDTAVSKVSGAFAKPTQAEFQLMAAQAAPNLELMPDANYSLTATQLGAAMWQDALRRDWLAAKSQGVQNFQAYQAAWKKQNSRAMFEDAAQRMLGNYAGQELPSADKLVSGGIYVVPAVKKGEKTDGLKKYLYENGFTAGDIVTIPKVNHYKDDQGKMQVDLDAPVKVPEDQIYQRILSQFNIGR